MLGLSQALLAFDENTLGEPFTDWVKFRFII
jgi:hypothetical protein